MGLKITWEKKAKTEAEGTEEKKPGKLKKVASTAAKVLGAGLLGAGAFLVGREYQKNESGEEADLEEEQNLDDIPEN